MNLLLSALLVALQVPDIVTTNWVLARGGRELNPLIRWCMRLGRWWWLPKMAVALAGAGLLAGSDDPASFWALVVLCLAYVLVVASNLRQIRSIRRREARWRETGR